MNTRVRRALVAACALATVVAGSEVTHAHAAPFTTTSHSARLVRGGLPSRGDSEPRTSQSRPRLNAGPERRPRASTPNVSSGFAAMTVDGTRHEVYVSTGPEGGVAVLDYEANVVGSVNLHSGNNPTRAEGEALVGGTLYVVTDTPSAIDAIDTSTLAMTTQSAQSLTSPTQLVEAGGKLWTDTTTPSGDCLASVNPSDGAAVVYSAFCYTNLLLRGNPFDTSMLIAFDGQASTTLTTIDVSGATPAVIESRLESGHQIADVAGLSANVFVATDGSSDVALEWQYSNLQPNGNSYGTQGSMSAVAATSQQGGLVAGADSAEYDAVVFHAGQSQNFTSIAGGAIQPGGLAFAPDGSEAFAMSSSYNTFAFTASFIYLPTINSVSPNRGPSGGGTNVAVSGAHFFEGTSSCQVTTIAILFDVGSASATPSTCSDTSVTFVTPAGWPGTFDVRLFTALNYSTTSTADLFTYDPIDVTAVSSQQYSLSGNNGSTWVPVDAGLLSVTFTAHNIATAIISFNADLWTASAGINQDIGILEQDNYGGSMSTPFLYSWTESGGGAGTFSPNAAVDEMQFGLYYGVTYVFTVAWKANVAEKGGTIFMGAGGHGTVSPSRLTARIISDSSVQSNESTQQYVLRGDDGTTWYEVDPYRLGDEVTATDSGAIVASASAALWTANAGLNQDIGIFVSDNGGPFELAAWKESGGEDGTFSPNAAYVQAVISATAGHAYTFAVALKTNVPERAGQEVAIGAGPSSCCYYYSESVLVTREVASDLLGSTAAFDQPKLADSDGGTWTQLEPSTFDISTTPAYDQSALLSFNADLWTASAGYNQDIGVFVSVDSAPPTLVGWKESGGSGGTFSPNAAFLQVVYPLSAGHQYDFTVRWKTNRQSGATIFAGAGPDGGYYSPSRLTVEVS